MSLIISKPMSNFMYCSLLCNVKRKPRRSGTCYFVRRMLFSVWVRTQTKSKQKYYVEQANCISTLLHKTSCLEKAKLYMIVYDCVGLAYLIRNQVTIVWTPNYIKENFYWHEKNKVEWIHEWCFAYFDGCYSRSGILDP